MTDLFSFGYEDKIEEAKNAPMKTVRFLSLFSGIGAFEKALDRCGIPYELIGYCEIDKYASKSYAAVHGVSEELNLWDVCKVDATPYRDKVDLLTYGFPCTDISIAGRQLGFFDEEGSYTRSGLFFEALRIIKECQPRIAIAENVRNLMSQAFVDQYHTVQESLGGAGYNNYVQILNAKDYGVPQNRERVFIVSIRKDIDVGYEFPNPIPLKLCLRDLLEDKVDEKYYLSERAIKGFEEHAKRNAENGNGFGWNVIDVGAPERERVSATLPTGSEKSTSTFIKESRRQSAQTPNPPQAVSSERVKEGRKEGRKDNSRLQPFRQGDAEQDGVRQFGIESDPLCGNGSRQHDAVCGRTQIGVLLSEKGTNLERETELAATLLARDYKGFGNQAMTGVLEIENG